MKSYVGKSLIDKKCRVKFSLPTCFSTKHLYRSKVSFVIITTFITGRNEVLAKVIFSQASVCPQGGSFFSGGVFFGGSSKFSGGGVFLGGVPPNFRGGGCILGGVSFFGGVPLNFWGGGFLQIWGVCLFGGGIFLGGCLFGGVVPPNFFWGGSPPEYGQCSAGTHPTGMHSCLYFYLHGNFTFTCNRMTCFFWWIYKWQGTFGSY